MIRDGAVAVGGGRIVDVGPAGDLESPLATEPSGSAGRARSCSQGSSTPTSTSPATGSPARRSPTRSRRTRRSSTGRCRSTPPTTADDDELSATLALVDAVTNGITFTVEAGTVGHPERVLAAYDRVGVGGTLGSWGSDTAGLPFAGDVAAVLDRQREVLALTAGHPGVRGWVTLVGHDLMSDELVVGGQPVGRRRRHGPDVPPLADGRRCSGVPGSDRAPTGGASRRPRRARPPRARRPRRARRRCRARRSCCAPGRQSPTARGPTCASARASPAPGVTPTSRARRSAGARLRRRERRRRGRRAPRRRPRGRAGQGHASPPDPLRCPHRARAGDDRRRRGDRDGRRDRLAGGRQARRRRRRRHDRPGVDPTERRSGARPRLVGGWRTCATSSRAGGSSSAIDGA